MEKYLLDPQANWLQKKQIIFSLDKIATIVNVMFDWIEQIPGATLDDSEVVCLVFQSITLMIP